MAADTCGVTPEMVGPDGKVAVWIIPDKVWVRKAPIDAIELIRVGSGSLDGDGNKPEDPPMPDQLKILSVREAAGGPPPRRATEPAKKIRGFPEPVKTTRPDR